MLKIALGRFVRAKEGIFLVTDYVTDAEHVLCLLNKCRLMVSLLNIQQDVIGSLDELDTLVRRAVARGITVFSLYSAAETKCATDAQQQTVSYSSIVPTSRDLITQFLTHFPTLLRGNICSLVTQLYVSFLKCGLVVAYGNTRQYVNQSRRVNI